MRTNVLMHNQDVGLSELFACYENYKITWCKGETARNIGDVLMSIDDEHLSDAGKWIQTAIEVHSRDESRFRLAQDHALYADWFKKKGDLLGAKEQLVRALDLFRKCGADGWVRKYEEEMAKVR